MRRRTDFDVRTRKKLLQPLPVATAATLLPLRQLYGRGCSGNTQQILASQAADAAAPRNERKNSEYVGRAPLIIVVLQAEARGCCASVYGDRRTKLGCRPSARSRGTNC